MSSLDRCATYLADVSRETRERLEIYDTLLRKWQKIKNLVSPSTIDVVWQRHFRDSLQLLQLCPWAKRWVDIGSGAGFPGMVIAIALADVPDTSVTLIESDNRKCAFLREVARQTESPALIRYGRAEAIIPELYDVDVVTARAVAPLDKLVEIAKPALNAGAIGLFPKGQDYRSELTRLTLPANFKIEVASSVTDDRAAIIIIRGSDRERAAAAI